ncbi:MAG: hypothetical protein MUC29_12745, partial [Pyrinomonadaceae bacterium]|nr:hypothetical protein [Pyrinomonadaceae bacterium]
EIRVRELAQSLQTNKQGNVLRQELIDYTWLLSKFENDSPKLNNIKSTEEAISYLEDYYTRKGYAIKIEVNEKVNVSGQVPVGYKLNVIATLAEYFKKPVLTTFIEEKANLKDVPFHSAIRDDELTNWLFTYQDQTDEAYLRSIEKFQQTSSDLWLMTAISKANVNSKDLKNLLKNADKISRDSVAYPTVVYHQVRLLIEQNKRFEAKKLLDEIINSTIDLPISTRNAFISQRMPLSETLSDFLKFSLKKPFAFGYDNDTEVSSIQDLINERKSYWNTESYPNQSKADYDAEVEKSFANVLTWESRYFLDYQSAKIINEHFSTETLLEILKDKDFPDYWKHRLIPVIWTRAYLLNDQKTALLIAPELVKLNPQIEQLMLSYTTAKTMTERNLAGLYLILKVRNLTPYLETGFEKNDFEEFSMWVDERWWCENYDGTYDENYEDKIATFKPTFLTAQQTARAKIERANLLKISDATSYLTKRVFDWYKIAPTDKRLPEALYVIYSINQWTKYGCGDYQEESRETANRLLITKFPKSKWTKKMIDEQSKCSYSAHQLFPCHLQQRWLRYL